MSMLGCCYCTAIITKILEMPNPTKWEYVAYQLGFLCLECALAAISFYYDFSPFALVMCILSILFLQGFSMCIVIYSFDTWLRKDASLSSAASGDGDGAISESTLSTVRMTNNRRQSSNPPINESVFPVSGSASSTRSSSPSLATTTARNAQDGETSKWIPVQGTMQYTVDENNRHNITITYYISIPLATSTNTETTTNTHQHDAIEERDGEERTVPQLQEPTEQRYRQEMKYYASSLPKWIKYQILGAIPNPTTSAIMSMPMPMPMRVHRSHPSFAVVCSPTDASQIIFPDKTTSLLGVFFGTLSFIGLAILLIVGAVPLTANIHMIWWYSWMTVQLLWGCIIGLAIHVNATQYKHINDDDDDA